MPLSPGDKIGHYQVLTQLGVGGMGEVYRALDTKLKRDVALKVLPEAFARDPERMARFQREAEVLASLNHTNIAQIYGVEERALAMELVEGEAPKGPLPFDEAWKIGSQIAAALEYAHDKGIIHRDLKPANIKVTPDGTIKLLDFGLAKAFTNRGEARSSDSPENSPTLTIGATEVGVILGTAAYMPPEQARGKAVDKRADIWSFGVVLYELLTGERLFKGEDTSDTLAQVLTKEPDLGKVPLKARKLLLRCLERDPKKRLRDIGEAAYLLDAGRAIAPSGSRFGRLHWIATAVLGVVAVATSWITWRATRPVDHPLTRLSVDLGPEAMMGLNTTVAISPDGRRLVYPARGPDGTQQLATRILDQAQATLLPGTESGFDPFFSPDGQWIAFFSGGELRKISVQGGAPITLCVANNPRGASWGDDGHIVADLQNLAPLSRVSAAGGTPQNISKLDAGVVSQRWPQVLPGGEMVLYTASPSNIGQDNANIEAISVKTGQVKILQRGGYYGRYLPSGHLVYVRRGVLFAIGFDPARLEVRGSPSPLLEDIAGNTVTGGGQFNFSGAASGTLVYLAGKGSAQSWGVSWLDRSGKMQPLVSTPGVYTNPHFSPDGTKLAFVNGGDIYIYDLKRDTNTRLTFTGKTSVPVWSPDGKDVVYQASGSGLSLIRSDGAGQPQILLESQNGLTPGSFSAEARRLAYYEQNPETGQDLWTLPLDTSDPDHPKPGKPEVFLRTSADENRPKFSPDGRWIAYHSNESGNSEIYVRPFPAESGGKWQISTGGGLYTFWSRNTRELFYETADYRIMVLDYTANGGSFVPGKPRLWFDTPIFYPGLANLDLAPDGKRFAALQTEDPTNSEKQSFHVTMLLNFFDELRRRVPAGK